jgi:hypothetical protein
VGGLSLSDVDWNALVEALLRVERLGPDDCGILSFDQPSNGGIFVERRQICWVAAPGLQRRLTDLLRAHSGLNGADLERVYERCRREGALLGQTLVAEGLLLPSQLERALRRHSAESLIALCPQARTTSWAQRLGRGYAPPFTFRPVELLFDCWALLRPGLRTAASHELSSFDGPGRHGAAFVLDTEGSSPVPLADTQGRSLAELLTLGRSVAALPAASHELGTNPYLALSATANGDARLVWWRDRVLYAMTFDDRGSLALATAQHLASA